MRRIVVDMQNALFTDAIAEALRNFESDFEVFESELPQKTAELCGDVLADVLIAEVTSYTPWTFEDRMKTRSELKKNCCKCKIVLTVDENVIIGGVGALIAKFAGASTLGFAFYLGLATTLVGGIIQLIAGINGVKHCNKPENAKKCITWGIIVIALAVISNVLEVIGGGEFNVLSFVLGLIVPGLYIYGAFLNHKENAR